MATYKTKDGTKTGFVPGVGPIVDGILKNAPDNLESANLEKILEQAAQPAPVAPAAPVASQPVVTQPQHPTNQETK